MTNIFKIILLAIVTAALAIVAEQILAVFAGIFQQKEIIFSFYPQFTWFLVAAAVTEETLKYWAIYFVIGKKLESHKLRLIAAAVLLGLAWGIFETGLVAFSEQNIPDALSVVAIIALHTLTAFLMGVFVSTSIDSGKLKHIKILAFPILLHLLFNFLIIQRGSFTNYFVVASLSVALLAGLAILVFNFRKLA